jgi:hypothetical protein
MRVRTCCPREAERYKCQCLCRACHRSMDGRIIEKVPFIHDETHAEGTYKTKNSRKPAMLSILVILHTNTYTTN